MIWHQRKKLNPELKDSFEQADLQELLLIFPLKDKEVKKLTRQKGEEAKTLLKKEELKSLLLEKKEKTNLSSSRKCEKRPLRILAPGEP